MYKVSILVPVYNVENFIARCAESLFSQDYDNLEFVFVDDCSPDGSMAVLGSVLEKFPERKHQVRTVRHERNKGLVAARKTALANATGEFIMWMDSDDWIEPGSISALVDKQIATGADIVAGSARQLLQGGEKVLFIPDFQTRESMIDAILKPDTLQIVVWSKIIRRSIFENNVFDYRDGHDYNEDVQLMPQVVYFANSAASIPMFVYNQVCTNPASMFTTGNTSRNVQSWRDALVSFSVLTGFFRDKEQRWNDAAHILGITQLRKYLKYAAKYFERNLFAEIVGTIDSEYGGYLSAIGWDKPLRKCIESHYLPMSAFYGTRAFIWHKIVKRILGLK